jgi:hypothetical protein
MLKLIGNIVMAILGLIWLTIFALANLGFLAAMVGIGWLVVVRPMSRLFHLVF